MNKKDFRNFINEVHSLMIINGFSSQMFGYYEKVVFEKQTKYGKLKLTIIDEESEIYTIYGKFDEFDRNAFCKRCDDLGVLTSINLHSHKWNTHEFSEVKALLELNNKLSIIK
mgnify:FL=1